MILESSASSAVHALEVTMCVLVPRMNSSRYFNFIYTLILFILVEKCNMAGKIQMNFTSINRKQAKPESDSPCVNAGQSGPSIQIEVGFLNYSDPLVL